MPSSDSTASGKNQRKAGTSEVRLGLENIIDPAQEEELHRRRVLARGASHDDIVQKLIALTGERPELVAYELGETEVQVYVLCGVDSDGYLNVLSCAPSSRPAPAAFLPWVSPLKTMWHGWLISFLLQALHLRIHQLSGCPYLGVPMSWSF